MSLGDVVALLGALAVVCTALGGIVGAWLTSRAQKRTAEATEHTVEVTAAATVKANEDSAQDKLIDQLQEELTRYRDDNDKRVERLEKRVEDLTEENRGYRAFIGVQRDHMAEHNVPLPPWPPHLPR